MKVDIIISADEIKKEKIEGKTVVVIDVLRATSTIVTALYNGCKAVVPVLTVEEAKSIFNQNRESYILGGERNALKIEGFDCSNSPLEYKKEVVRDKELVITTTNGTKAIKGSVGAKNIIIGSMLNGFSVAKKIVDLDNDVVFVNAGTFGEFSLDDFVCSGYILECLKTNCKAEVEMSDIAATANYMYKSNEDLSVVLKMAKHYNRIIELGLKDDLEYCSKRDIIDIVPEYLEGKIS